jgi:pimeloyl-ACP methyl ester carboxylesterase
MQTMDSKRATWKDWGGEGPDLHFAHGNGFPPGTYMRVIRKLASRFHVQSLEARPLWPGEPGPYLRNWDPLVRDIANEIRARDMRGCVAVGHSLGGVCSLLAAAEDPGLFGRIVAIDPVLFTGGRSIFWRLMKRTGLTARFPLVRNAARRRVRWDSREQVRKSYSGKALFATWCPDCLDAYLDEVLEPVPDGGVMLRYPPDWEAAVFAATPCCLWDRLARLSVPVLVLRGSRSTAFTRQAARRFEQTVPNSVVREIPGTHMVPVERPDEVARAVLEFLG